MDASLSASSSSSTSVPEVRLAELVDRMQTTYAGLPEMLCSASRPSSPSHEKRVAAWKSQFANAFEVSGCDTTHPKWGYVSRLSQLATTSRGYVGVAPGIRIGDGHKVSVGKNFEWELPETEEEWMRYEKKFEAAIKAEAKKAKSKSVSKATRTSKYWPTPVEDQPQASSSRPQPAVSKAEIIRKKVERWQAGVATDPEDAPASQSTIDLSQSSKAGKGKEKAKAKTKKSVASGEKVQASLGFRVMKRSSVTGAKGGLNAASQSKATPLVSSPKPFDRKAPSKSSGEALQPLKPCEEMQLPEGLRNAELPQIAEVPELSFLPPSFPSQLQTSTPPLNSKRQKPAPIAPRSPPPSSPQSPNSSKSFDASRPQRPDLPMASSSPPAAPPARLPPKRAHSPNSSTDVRMDVSVQLPPLNAPPRKKARTVPLSEQEPTSSGPQPVPPSTPPPATSPLKAPVTPVSRGKGLGNAKGLPVPTTPDTHSLPTLTELLASSRRSRPRPRPPSRKHTPQSTTASRTKSSGRHAEAEGELPMVEDEREPSPSPTKTYFSSPASGSSSSGSVLQRSPVSPLFSQNPAAFTPAFVSSQRPSANDGDPFLGGPVQSQSQGGGFFGLGYNSQFDVEGQVDRVSELLERDVDYHGWLRDLDEEEDMPQTQSQGAVGVEY
ncbi:hypothetical protein C8Q79DRAFT_906473 [Trametes meyenii]|nr:hypothetical protein C8Q79DRAFT_906473 [Trametes meyenii]